MSSTDTVVVIGGSSGLGLAVARRCLAQGASVVIAGRSTERLEAARVDLGGPGRLRAIAADIGDRAQVAALFEQAGPIGYLVVTAADLPYGPVAELTEDSQPCCTPRAASCWSDLALTPFRPAGRAAASPRRRGRSRR